MAFSKDFLWGAASSAAQIEGGWDEDGRTPSIWDNMPDWKVNKNENPHTACDHYHRWQEDVTLMKEMGLKAYRFSISWSRVIPARGQLSQEGIAFYRNLIDALTEANITPMITLYHSDLPQWVYDMGGWSNPEAVEEFAFYAKTMVEAFSDKVCYWFTMNETQCMLPDFVEMSGADASTVYRLMLLAHGRAVQAMRKAAKQSLKIGMVVMGMVVEPAPGAIPESVAANMTFSDMGGFMTMSRWTDPIFLGKAPESMKDVLSPEDMATIHQPLDLFCANIYGSANFYDNPGRMNPLSYPGIPKSHIGMPVRPDCMYYLAKFAWERYRLPVLFTENGFSNIDFVMLDGKVHDPQRIDYIHRYLLSLKKAVDEGIPVEGYLYWSVMDNFEWLKGYDLRFGLIYIDYPTQTRTLKDSAYYYRDVIATNGKILYEEERDGIRCDLSGKTLV